MAGPEGANLSGKGEGVKNLIPGRDRLF